MGYFWGTRSRNRMRGLHPDIVTVLERLIEVVPFDVTVLEGMRNKTTQALYVKRGVSWTMNSRHLTGHAVDIAPLKNGKIDWNDIGLFVELGRWVFKVADELGIVLQWGGDWDLDGDWRDEKKFDGPHWQVPWPYRMADAKRAQNQRIMTSRLLKHEHETDPPEADDDDPPETVTMPPQAAVPCTCTCDCEGCKAVRGAA